MAIAATVRRASFKFTDLVLDATGRWAKAFDDATAGALTADQVVTDGVIILQKSVSLWMTFMPQGAPLVPVIYIEHDALTLPGLNPGESAFLDEPLPAAAVVTATPLQLLGGAGAIPVSVPAPNPLLGTFREEIRVELAVLAGNPAPAVGTYEGVVYVGAKLLATVVARIF